MFNVLLDPLPEEWNGYSIDPDFRIGIQITMCLDDKSLSIIERQITAINLLFPDDENRPDIKDGMLGVKWFLNEYNHDKHKGSAGSNPVSFDNDQWRIYAAFLNQYRIDLNVCDMHWFTFMGLLSNLNECSFNGVVDIRQKNLNDKKMNKEEKEAYRKAKSIYSLQEEALISDEEKALEDEAVAHFQRLIGR